MSVLLRLDAEGEHPYAVIYHEYTHFLLARSADWLPLWLNEGLAQFYENTDIHDKDVALGQPSTANLYLLRENRLLPLSALFTIDMNSPYYHEENKGSIFYAESWALTHYLFIKDYREKTQHIPNYAELLAQRVDPVTAATRAFGDLKQLQSNLESYIRQGSFSYFKMPSPAGMDESSLKTRALTALEADAARGDFLAYNERAADARPLLDHVLLEDPKNVSAHETMGFLEFRAGHMEEARQWYQKAVKLDSQSYAAHYYFAAISMNQGAGSSDDAQVEASLRAAIKLNPSFAPSFERLAAFEGMRRKNLDEAHIMAIRAVELDPGNVSYRMTAASVLMQMEKSKDAAAVLRQAMRVAKSATEEAMVQNFLVHAEESATHQQSEMEQNHRLAENSAAVRGDAGYIDGTTSEPEVAEEVPKGPHRFLSGTLQNVQCHAEKIDLTISSGGKATPLQGGNYYKIEFTALGFTPAEELNPCKDLEGKPAKVGYVDSSAKASPLYVVSIELHK